MNATQLKEMRKRFDAWVAEKNRDAQLGGYQEGSIEATYLNGIFYAWEQGIKGEIPISLQQFVPPVVDERTLPDKMCYVGGSERSFRCVCGCNVFKEFEPLRYKCNSCGETYTGEK